MKFWFCLALFSLALCSCRFSGEGYGETLDSLDRRLEKFPFQVRDTLFRMDTAGLDKGQQMYRKLLLVAADDACGAGIEDDSMLNGILRFCQGRKRYDYMEALTHYYLGVYLQDRERFSRADYHYRKSLSRFKESGKASVSSSARIFSRLAQVSYRQHNDKVAGNLCRKAFQLFRSVRDTFNTASVLWQWGLVNLKEGDQVRAEQMLLASAKLLEAIRLDLFPMKKRQAAVYGTLGRFYMEREDLDKALLYAGKCAGCYDEAGTSQPALYHSLMAHIYSSSDSLEEASLSFRKMIAAARMEGNPSLLFDGFRNLYMLKLDKEVYHEAYRLNEAYNRIKDSMKLANFSDNLVDFEDRFCKMEADRFLYRTRLKQLKLLLVVLLLFFIALTVSIVLYFRHKKLKGEKEHLAEAYENMRWGFRLTSEFISENHFSYDELERLLNREKSVGNLNGEAYSRFSELLGGQRTNCYARLLQYLDYFGNRFTSRLQKQFPELGSEDLLLAAMIHHRWKAVDMAAICHISLDALRKRKLRLGGKLSSVLKRKVDIEAYLQEY